MSIEIGLALFGLGFVFGMLAAMEIVVRAVRQEAGRK